jgi:DNA-binding SARP family transcriptional activator
VTTPGPARSLTLADTRDPLRLVPGDANQCHGYRSAYALAGDQAEAAAMRLRRNNMPGWDGDAADAARARGHSQAAFLFKHADVSREVGVQYGAHGDAIASGQSKVRHAVGMADEADQLAAQADEAAAENDEPVAEDTAAKVAALRTNADQTVLDAQTNVAASHTRLSTALQSAMTEIDTGRAQVPDVNADTTPAPGAQGAPVADPGVPLVPAPRIAPRAFTGASASRGGAGGRGLVPITTPRVGGGGGSLTPPGDGPGGHDAHDGAQNGASLPSGLSPGDRTGNGTGAGPSGSHTLPGIGAPAESPTTHPAFADPTQPGSTHPGPDAPAAAQGNPTEWIPLHQNPLNGPAPLVFPANGTAIPWQNGNPTAPATPPPTAPPPGSTAGGSGTHPGGPLAPLPRSAGEHLHLPTAQPPTAAPAPTNNGTGGGTDDGSNGGGIPGVDPQHPGEQHHHPGDHADGQPQPPLDPAHQPDLGLPLGLPHPLGPAADGAHHPAPAPVHGHDFSTGGKVAFVSAGVAAAVCTGYLINRVRHQRAHPPAADGTRPTDTNFPDLSRRMAQVYRTDPDRYVWAPEHDNHPGGDQTAAPNAAGPAAGQPGGARDSNGAQVTVGPNGPDSRPGTATAVGPVNSPAAKETEARSPIWIAMNPDLAEAEGYPRAGQSGPDLSPAPADSAAPVGGRPGLVVGKFPDGRDLRLDLTAAPGIGIQGEGTASALRGLISEVIVSQTYYPAGTIVITDDDAAALNLKAGRATPSGIWATETLDDALDLLADECDLRADMPPRDEWPLMVLILAQPPEDTEQAELVAALAAHGGRYGVAVVVGGPWSGGPSLAVDQDGMVTVARGDTTAPAYGARLFSLHTDNAHQILTALAHITAAKAADAPPQPATPADDHDDQSARADDNEQELDDQPEARADQTDPDTGPSAPDLTRLSCAPGTYRLEILNRVRLLYTPEATPDNDQPQPQLAPLTHGNPACQAFTALALHPDGLRKERLTSLVWPDSASPGGAYRTTMHRVRQNFADQFGNNIADPIQATGKHLQLDPTIVTVDYWDLLHTLTLNNTDELDQKTAAFQIATANYHDDFASEIEAPWIEPYRQELRDKTVTAAVGIADALAERGQYDRAIAILEHAATVDEYNEQPLRRIIEIHHRAGDKNSAERARDRLTKKLAELGVKPHDEASSDAS